MLIVRKLIVDDRNDLFDARGMEYREFPSKFEEIREYTRTILKQAPSDFHEGSLLEQQLSEIIKNGIKHGNRCQPDKTLRVWYDFRGRARFIVEDQGQGFQDLEKWNEFYYQRQLALHREDFDKFLGMARYVGPKTDEHDGGNSLMSALEYWNGGMIFNAKRNKVGVIRWFSRN